MTADLTTRVAELAVAIEANLAEDELIAQDASLSQPVYGTGRQVAPDWFTRDPDAYVDPDDDEDDRKPQCVRSAAGMIVYDEGSPTAEQAEHIARHDPASVLRRVTATRDLMAAILAEKHDYNPLDGYYSCSQAVDPDPYPGEDGGPGSGCSDPDRKGQPCDCGRDQRVARLLEIIASEWEDS